MTSIKIDNVIYEDCPKAQAIVRALQGKTYMNLQVQFCPVGGSCDVMVETNRPETSKAELTEMVLAVLCASLPR